MKRLTITYGDQTVFDADIEQYTCEEDSHGIKVAGRIRKQAASSNGGGGLGGGLGGVLDILAKASKSRTAEYGEQKRAAYAEQKRAQADGAVEPDAAVDAETAETVTDITEPDTDTTEEITEP